MGSLGEVHESVAAVVLLQEGIVLVAELAPEHAETDDLAPVELLEQRYAVEQSAVEVPLDHGRGETVVQELHVVDKAEGLGLDDVRQVGGGLDEQRIGNLVPLDTALEADVELAPAAEPEALVDAQLGVVVVVVAAKHAVEAHGVGNGDDGSVEVDDAATQLVVDIGLTGSIAQAGGDFGGAQVFVVAVAVEVRAGRRVERAERELAAGFVFLDLGVERGLQSPISLVVEGDLLTVVEHHLVGLCPLEGYHEVILVGIEETVAGQADVTVGLDGECAAWELMGQVLLGVDGIGDLCIVVVLVAAPSMAYIG